MIVYTVSFHHQSSLVSAPLAHVKTENLPRQGHRARKEPSQPSQPRPALLAPGGPSPGQLSWHPGFHLSPVSHT